MAFDDGARDTARFIPEVPVVALRFELLGEQKNHHDQSNRQRHQNHGKQDDGKRCRFEGCCRMSESALGFGVL